MATDDGHERDQIEQPRNPRGRPSKLTPDLQEQILMRISGRVEMWRGRVGTTYLYPALSSAGASVAAPCSVSTSRSSNRTCGSPASGSRTRHSCVRTRKTAPNVA